MNFGQGMQFIGLTPPAGPPFPATSADNGDSIDPVTGRIVLGNDVGAMLAQLLSPREIPMNGQSIAFSNVAGESFSINDTITPLLFSFWSSSPIALLNDLFGNRFFQLDQVAGIFGIGDLDIANNGAFLNIDDTVGSFELQGGSIVLHDIFAARFLQANSNTGFYGLGDLDNANSGQAVIVNDAAHLARLGDVVGAQSGALITLSSPGSGNYGQVAITTNSDSQPGKALRFSIFNQPAVAESYVFADTNPGGTQYLVLDALNTLYSMGDVNTIGNGTKLVVDDAGSEIDLVATSQVQHVDATNHFFISSPATARYEFGDLDGVGNSTSIRINDTSSQLEILAAAGVQINGTNGFTGTVTPVVSITVIGGIVTAVA